jgi:hypothetical protein
MQTLTPSFLITDSTINRRNNMTNVIKAEQILKVELLHKDYITVTAWNKVVEMLMRHWDCSTEDEVWNKHIHTSDIMTTEEQTDEELMYALGINGQLSYSNVIHDADDISLAVAEVVQHIESIERLIS